MSKITARPVKSISVTVERNNGTLGNSFKYTRTFRTAKAAAKFWAEHVLWRWTERKYWLPGAAPVKQDDRYWKEQATREDKYFRRALPIFRAMLA